MRPYNAQSKRSGCLISADVGVGVVRSCFLMWRYHASRVKVCFIGLGLEGGWKKNVIPLRILALPQRVNVAMLELIGNAVRCWVVDVQVKCAILLVNKGIHDIAIVIAEVDGCWFDDVHWVGFRGLKMRVDKSRPLLG